MKLARIHVDGVKARSQILSLITAGLVGATVDLEITGPEWQGLSRTVVFKSNVTRDVLDVGSSATVPADVVATPGEHLRVGVYGIDADRNIVIPTIWCDLGRIMDAADPSGDPSTNPALPVWAQLQKHIGDLGKLKTNAKESLVAAINEVHDSGGPGGGTGGGGLAITDDGNGNVTISSSGSVSITDDGNGNVVIAQGGWKNE